MYDLCRAKVFYILWNFLGEVKIFHSTLKYHELRILAFFIEKQQGSSFSKYQAISGDMTGEYVSTPSLQNGPEAVLNGVGS